MKLNLLSKNLASKPRFIDSCSSHFKSGFPETPGAIPFTKVKTSVAFPGSTVASPFNLVIKRNASILSLPIIP